VYEVLIVHKLTILLTLQTADIFFVRKLQFRYTPFLLLGQLGIFIISCTDSQCMLCSVVYKLDSPEKISVGMPCKKAYELSILTN